MPGTPSTWTIRWLPAITSIRRSQWDSLAESLTTPLMEYRWLAALEESGSITPRQGWQPCHLTVWDRERLIGAAPLYIKTHNGGEFIFDYWWVEFVGEYGIEYYPKLVGMSPATPATGYRFLMVEDVDHQQLMRTILAAIDQLCAEQRLTGCHLHYIDREWFNQFDLPGYFTWHHQSYLWQNSGYRSFTDYLARFKSSQRRNIRRERASMTHQGITIHAHRGEELDDDFGSLMYRYYLNTNDRYGPWAARFLNGDFFHRIFQDYRHRLLVMAAYHRQANVPIALSMLLVKERQLLGRYWGCATPVKDLHFNMCYYAPLTWAIDNGIQGFDPGIGSPHKIARGFVAVSNTSLHRFNDPRLDAIFSQIIDQVNTLTAHQITELNRQLPFARGR